jgi:hypothetical protein
MGILNLMRMLCNTSLPSHGVSWGLYMADALSHHTFILPPVSDKCRPSDQQLNYWVKIHTDDSQ